MFGRILLTAAFGAAILWAQTKLSADQVINLTRSSIQLKHEDRKVAEYLRKVQITSRLTERDVEELQAMGAGPKTMEALRNLAATSAGLPPPPPPAPRPVIPGPDPAEQQKILGRVRENALNYTRRLPDFLCMQVTRRHVDPTGMEFWRLADTITERLSYVDGKEDYKVIQINHQPVNNVSHEQLGGATSSGEFGSMLKEIFEPSSQTEFAWERWATLRGRRMHVFTYRVRQDKSKYNIVFERTQNVVAGYRGLIYVDRDKEMVIRITLEASVPPAFPIQGVALILDYDPVKIGEGDYVLPLRAELRSRQGKFLSRNEVEFRLYRKFTAEATISFDTPDPLPEESLKEQPPPPATKKKN